MDSRVRTAKQTIRAPAPPNRDKEPERKKAQVNRPMDSAKPTIHRQSTRERKIALQQEVDKLKTKLRQEENIRRALERAFTRPLGALPRIPPYLPSHTLELVAEVAVLEEEVLRLEEQVVNSRQAIYQEAIDISPGKAKDSAIDSSQNSKGFEQLKSCSRSPSTRSSSSSSMRLSSDDALNFPSGRFSDAKPPLKKPNPSSASPEDRCEKENQLINSNIAKKQSPVKMLPPTERQSDLQLHCLETSQERQEHRFCSTSEAAGSAAGPNKLSEDILKCLLSIFSTTKLQEDITETESSSENSEDTGLRDPYGICSEFGARDVGPYKNFREVDARSIDSNFITHSPCLTRGLKLLLKELALVELSGLNHQQKLAFWINIYNSCIMNAYLNEGIPANPQMVIASMTKAMINVGGHSLSAMTIEHFILRLPYHSNQFLALHIHKHTYQKGLKSGEMKTRVAFGLDWPEPLVTFALSCGSWSSPVVRVYTASQVEQELETAKRDYLQAAVAIAIPNKLAIPKLLDWYLLDFAKDVESLMDWICLQLPDELRNDAVRCVEKSRVSVNPQPIQVTPYNFGFRYLLAP